MANWSDTINLNDARRVMNVLFLAFVVVEPRPMYRFEATAQ